MQVLIAEDDFLISMVIEKMVQKMGYEIAAVCRTGKDTIQQVAATHPDCILLDYYLNDEINGYDIMMKVRERFQIPVIFISGQSSHFVISKIKQIKHSTLISKPFTYSDLKEAIEGMTKPGNSRIYGS